VMARLAPISAHPRAASIPIPLGPDAPVTTTTLPFKLNKSVRDSALGIEIGMVCGDEFEFMKEEVGMV